MLHCACGLQRATDWSTYPPSRISNARMPNLHVSRCPSSLTRCARRRDPCSGLCRRIAHSLRTRSCASARSKRSACVVSVKRRHVRRNARQRKKNARSAKGKRCVGALPPTKPPQSLGGCSTRTLAMTSSARSQSSKRDWHASRKLQIAALPMVSARIACVSPSKPRISSRLFSGTKLGWCLELPCLVLNDVQASKLTGPAS
mmetsp:Transcript_34336/g.90333  ORF Transcript_34336/g.90333 Transcript_34336/m.90333 type:complete len:202 (-) Transcript_34336:1240-1845(-)